MCLVVVEKRRRMRQEEGEARRRDWNERLQGKTMGQDSESDSGGRRRAGENGTPTVRVTVGGGGGQVRMEYQQ